jgi:integrase
MIFKRLSDAKVIRDNPARSIKSLSENERIFHVITSDEEKKYLLAAPQPLLDVAILMLETGMRCGEVYQLRQQDVSLEKGFLKVAKGKTRSSVRRVHLSARAQAVLSSRLKRFEGENLFPKNAVDGERAIVNLNNLHLQTIRLLGFSFRLYDCRHTFATRALESGVDLLTLASILGHSNLKMVSRYAHPSEQHKADAIRRMEKNEVGKRAKAV